MNCQKFARGLQTAARQSQTSSALRIARTSFPVQKFAAPSASTRLASRRWYSAETEAKKDDAATQEKAAEAPKDDATQKELEAKKKELLEVTDRLKRSIAEYRNLQDQTKREVAAARDFAIQKFAKDLIDSVDNLDRALSTVPADKLSDNANSDLISLHSGLKMTEAIMMSTLKKHGLERFDPAVEGEKFDPNKHEATFQAPQPDKQDGSVFFTQQKGFALNGRVIRPAKVGVVRNS